MKKRLDVYLVEKGCFETREKAQLEIKNGSVCVDKKVITKPSFCVDENMLVEVVGEFLKYVSRAGLKIEKAKQFFNIDFLDKVVLDIGASTGGFTDFCLQNGAKKVFAVDVGTNQLHEKLKNDKRVVCIENTDIRTLKALPDQVDIAVCDVSFISLTKIGDAVSKLLPQNKHFMALIKPQFECGLQVAKKYHGVIKDEKIHAECVEKVTSYLLAIGFDCLGVCQSPIKGGDGNIEFLSYFVKNR